MKLSITILFVFSMLVEQAQINLGSSLTACYALNGNANDPISSLNGTISMVTATVDRFNNSNSAYAFSGTQNSYVELPNSPLLKANQVSFSAWVSFNSLNTAQYLVFTHNGCNNYHEGYMLAVNNWIPGGFRLQMAKADNSCTLLGQATLNGSQILTTNTWYHVGFYIGPDSLKLYLNGNLESTMFNSNPLLFNPATGVFLGGSTIPAFNAPLDGSFDNVRFYNRKLSNSEFLQLYTLDPVCREVNVGIHQPISQLHLVSVYPNPSENWITIDNINYSGGGHYTIEDASGRQLIKGELEVQAKTTINCTLLSNGIYFVRITAGKQEVVKKFMKH